MQKHRNKEVHSNIQNWRETYRQMDNYKPIKSIRIFTGGYGEPSTRFEEIHVRVFYETTISVIEACAKFNFSPLVVNIISNNHPLDALKSGAMGEQYDILRRTNFYNTISDSMFPLQDYDSIYSEQIVLFKDGQNKTLRRPIKFSMISLVSPGNPRVITIASAGGNHDIYENANDEKFMINKLENIFNIASSRQHDCIILPDIGCKAGGPIHKIIEFLNSEISRRLVPYVFFAIKDAAIPPEKNVNFLQFHKNIRRILPPMEEDVYEEEEEQEQEQAQEDEENQDEENQEQTQENNISDVD